ncbi:ras-like protein family member 10A isoform X1 [Macaca nemestrina]|uniref:ras-like protein family member 10A isoform X1 n=1 Tax=Macaca nemestrina TaxID=9545 RepID=UPI0039B8613B
MGGSLRVAVLGAPGVGKTAIIRQFLFGDYPERHRPTDGPRLYRPAVLLDGAVYDLSIRDGDVAGPGSSPGGPEEWPDPKDWSLQDTDAFVLVYDICSPDSFDYVKALRQRIAETRWGRGRSGGGELGQVWPGLCLRGVCRVSQRRGPGLRPSPVGRSSAVCALLPTWAWSSGRASGCRKGMRLRVYTHWGNSPAVGSPAPRLSSPFGPQAGGRARSAHPGGRQQARQAAAALRTAARAGRPGAQGLALRLPRVLGQVQLARAASLPRAAALRSGARAPCTPGPAPAGGAASSALQPHVTQLDSAIHGPHLVTGTTRDVDWTGSPNFSGTGQGNLCPDWMRPKRRASF